jgi:hypothetical protein
MKARITTCVLLLSVVPGIALASSPPTKVSEVAGATGLTERQVKMVFGCHTAYAEYRTSYEWARHRAMSVLGAQRYNELMAGHEIVLDNGRRVALLDR